VAIQKLIKLLSFVFVFVVAVLVFVFHFVVTLYKEGHDHDNDIRAPGLPRADNAALAMTQPRPRPQPRQQQKGKRHQWILRFRSATRRMTGALVILRARAESLNAVFHFAVVVS
jgi:hypothetical protein